MASSCSLKCLAWIARRSLPCPGPFEQWRRAGCGSTKATADYAEGLLQLLESVAHGVGLRVVGAEGGFADLQGVFKLGAGAG
jgi:hypothetical protein